MTLTDTELSELEKLSLKNESVKKLLDFYVEAQEDGEKMLGIAFNKMMLSSAEEYSSKKLQDITPEELIRTKTISEIFKNLKTITGGNKKEEKQTKSEKKHNGKVTI